jgi:phosphoglycerate dehydrogenase-like enzyme
MEINGPGGCLETSPLLELVNVVLKPHIAFLSNESIDECTDICVEKRVDVREVQASK